MALPRTVNDLRRWNNDNALYRWRWPLLIVLGVVVVAVLAARDIDLPELWVFPLAGWIDDRVDWLTVNAYDVIQPIKQAVLWILVRMERGLLAVPQWVIIAPVVALAWRKVSWKMALLTLGGLLFLGDYVGVGLWAEAMSTVAIVGTATLLSIAVGIPVGILMSKSDATESSVRPILDFLQTMPSFVYLVPAVLLLGLGKVPAVLAVVIYAIAPCIRLTNLGIRLVAPELVEAARSFGTSPWQLLLKVQLPLARPTIMAGINQTIMMALAMAVVASMIGAKGLGAEVLNGIARLEVGRGFNGGMGIVILAILIDRLSQAFAKDPTQRGS